jgi:hypothetical protein
MFAGIRLFSNNSVKADGDKAHRFGQPSCPGAPAAESPEY